MCLAQRSCESRVCRLHSPDPLEIVDTSIMEKAKMSFHMKVFKFGEVSTFTGGSPDCHNKSFHRNNYRDRLFGLLEKGRTASHLVSSYAIALGTGKILKLSTSEPRNAMQTSILSSASELSVEIAGSRTKEWRCIFSDILRIGELCRLSAKTD